MAPGAWGVAVVMVVGLAAVLSYRTGASAWALAATCSIQAAVAFAGLTLVSRRLDRLEASST